MQKKQIKIGYLLTFLVLVNLSSCADSTHIQECKNMKKIILANNAEIARIYKEQQPLSSGNIQRAELDIRRAQIQEKNSNLQQNYQIKCSK
jgi:hypothetical protein